MSTTEQTVELIIYACAAPVTAFPLIYGLLAPWWRSVVGRWLMWQSTMLAVVMWLIVTSTYFGEYPGRQWVRLLVYCLLFCAFCTGIAVLVAQQLAGRRQS